jgi:hypothetical protein
MVKRLLVAMTAVAVFAAGCADTSSSSSASSGARASAAPESSSELSPAGPSEAASPAVATGQSTKLTGTLEAGVEPNCVLLRAAGRPHLLIFGNPQLQAQAKIGDKVTVVGRPRPTQMTTCQQGVPFVVETLVVD